MKEELKVLPNCGDYRSFVFNALPVLLPLIGRHIVVH